MSDQKTEIKTQYREYNSPADKDALWEEVKEIHKKLNKLNARDDFLRKRSKYLTQGPKEFLADDVMEDLFEHVYGSRAKQLRWMDDKDWNYSGNYSIHKMFLKAPAYLEKIRAREKYKDECARRVGRGKYHPRNRGRR